MAVASDANTNGSPRPPIPWRVRDVITFYAASVAAAMLVLIGWWGASGTAYVSHQALWAAIAIGGLIVAGAGNAVLVITGRRMVAVRRNRLTIPLIVSNKATAVETRPDTDATALVATAAMTRYHRPDCPLVIGKGARKASLATHHKKGRRPCGVCAP